jgi:arsenite methyltransferase
MKAEPNLTADVTELVDVDELRREVKEKYREVASNPHGDFHFHTGREQALRMGYPRPALDALPDEATDAFAGVGNPFYWGTPESGERVIDLGSGAGMDSLLSALAVGPEGRVIGVDMTFEMLERARNTARSLGLNNVEFRVGVIEELPVESAWADVVISNGVVNLCADKVRVYKEVYRVLKPGGRLTIADICVDKAVPESALRDIDLWTG